MIGVMNHEQHDRPGTEVEGHVITQLGAGMAVRCEILEPEPLDAGHANRLDRPPPPSTVRSESSAPAATLGARLSTWVM